MDPTQETQPTADAQFADAFNEMAGPSQSGEEAPGTIPGELPPEVADAAGTDGADIDAAAQSVVDAPDQATGGMDLTAAAAADEGGAGEPAAAAMDADARMQEIRQHEQRLKSWEGRLRAEARKQGKPETPMEDGLNAGAGPGAAADAGTGADVIEEVANAAEQNGDASLAAAADELAEKVENAEITVQEARKILAEDFGDSFLNLIELLVRDSSSKHAGDAIGSLQTSTSAEIASIKNAYQRNHFKQIQAAHKDFREVAATPEFKTFADADPARKAVIDGGDAFDVIELLDQFKQQGQTIDPHADKVASQQASADVDGAEVVRATGGINLPATPTSDQSYEAAWAQL